MFQISFVENPSAESLEKASSEEDIVSDEGIETVEPSHLEEGKQEVSALPLTFTTLLQNTEASVLEDVELHCEMSQIGVEVSWLKDNNPLSLAEGRYELINKDFTYSLLIPSVTPDDSGQYTIQAGDLQSTAVLTVKDGQ